MGIPNGLAAVSKVPTLGWAQIDAYFGFCEFSGGFEDYKTGTPGDYGFKVLTSADPAEKTKKLAAEIANGRLAMVAIIGMFFQDGLTGSAWGDWSLYTASPLRAFESELGVQEPVGFWDPLGFTADGDVASFKRRRSVEIKHGRICMLATMGYITPEITGKLPGFLSPSTGLKYADIPNGLAAVSKVPPMGWAQILAYCGFVEASGGFAEYKTGTPGDYGFKVLPSPYPAEREKKLQAELANGRLAMMAVMGMFFQDGLTGSAWGDWALYTDSPLRAGVLDGTGGPRPDDFWDPVGLAKGKSDEQLLRWRAVELKNGRVAMLAVLGWFHVAAGYHPIGDAAARTRVSDDPLINATQLPMAGAWQVVFTIMCLEWVSTYVAPPPKDAPWDVIGWSRIIAKSDDDSWKMAQLREIDNGRLAMMAIVGLV